MLTGELKEALAELINISYGSATAAIAELFDNFATLHVPGITIIPVNLIETVVLEGQESQRFYITTQQFKGTFEGEIIFSIGQKSAVNMQSIFCETEELEADNTDNDTEIQQSILEISNILGSSCIGKLAELLDSDVSFSPPTIESDHEHLIGIDKTSYSQVIVISTVLKFEDARISGNLFIMFNNEMFVWLEKSLEAFLEDYT